MPLVKLEFQPGINKEKTVYSNTGGWYDCNLVRFRFGLPERMGGWTQRNGTAFLGTSRHLHLWTLLDTTPLIGVGTHLKYYLDKSGTYNDITPLREAGTNLGATPFNLVINSAVVTVNDTAHGSATGDYVTMSNATTDFNGILAAELNANHLMTVIDNDSYTITLTTVASSNQTGVGPDTYAVAYEIGTGLNDTVQGIGWGRNEWQDGTGSRGWGGDGIDDFVGRGRLWSADNFGEDLIFNARDGGIYYWDATDGVTARAELLQDQGGASAVPEVCRQIIISTEDRHILALGCGPLGAETVQDPMLIRWPDQESFVDWTPSSTNTAGSLRLSNGSYIVGGIRTKREILVWTDTALHTIQFTGPPNIFGLRLVATNTSLIGPNAVVEADDAVYWMGRNNFFVYTGTTQTIPCSLRSHVFDNININQYDKFCAGLNRSHYEVFFFYCSKTSNENDLYVCFNYMEKVWYHGSLSRTCWADRNFTAFPLAGTTDGYLYNHEDGWDDGSQAPAAALNPYIESSDIELPGEGYQFAFIRRLIPDVTFQNSTVEAPMATVTMTPRDFPGFGYKTADAPTLTRSASTPVELYTKHAHVRLRGRALKYRIESSGLGVFWRQGTPRIEVRPDGRR
jgi:hypothetical protein